MSTPSAPALPAPRRRPVGRALVAATWAGALAGAVIGLVSLLSTSPSSAPAPTNPGIAHLGQHITTSFGTMSVDYVVRLTGAPNPMGVPDAAGQLPVQVAVTLTNLRKQPLRVTPQMFEMPAIVSGGGIDSGASRGDGSNPSSFAVKSLTAHRFQLRYAVPDAATLPRLKFHDPGARRPVVIALGSSKGLGTLNVIDHHFSQNFAG
jgi:hypothetical protein